MYIYIILDVAVKQCLQRANVVLIQNKVHIHVHVQGWWMASALGIVHVHVYMCALKLY